jgi:putative ABC transport system permease protein
VLAKSPGFTAAAVLSLSLGIGVNTLVFSAVNAVVLRPLPYRDPGQLVWVARYAPAFRSENAGAADYQDWSAQAHVFQGVAAYANVSSNLGGAGTEPVHIVGARVSASLFDVLKIKPWMGRPILASDDRPGAPGVAVLTHELFDGAFRGDAHVLGTSITVDGEPFTVIGVLPPGFRFPDPAGADLLVPLRLPPVARGGPQPVVRVVGRLQPGITAARALADLKVLENNWSPFEKRMHIEQRMRYLHDQLMGDTRPALLVLLGAAALVLLIACANLANLLLARGSARNREIAVRFCLGAGRGRVLRQLCAESALIALAGGGLGLLVAAAGMRPLVALAQGRIALLAGAAMDGRVLAFTLASSIAVGVLAGMAPTVAGWRIDLNQSLKAGSRRSNSDAVHMPMRRVLVISEVAMATMLLAGAGLLMKSLWNLQHVDSGFLPENVLTMQMKRNRFGNVSQVRSAFDVIAERIQTIPGVDAAGAWTHIGIRWVVLPLHAPAPPMGQEPRAELYSASGNLFRALGMTVLRGRTFVRSDTEGAHSVLVINEALARRMYGTGDAVGRHVTLGNRPGDRDVEVVGVVRDVRNSGLDVDPQPAMYRPGEQAVDPPEAEIVVRAKSEPRPDLAGLAKTIRGEVLAVTRDQPVYNVQTLEQQLAGTIAPRRMNMLVLAMFGTLALVLAGIGVYAVLAYAVSARTHEIGVRMALGAGSGDVLKWIMGESALLAGAGVLVGILGAAALTRLMAGMLYGVQPIDLPTFGAAAGTLALVATAASLVPARRAVRVDPLVALRYE